VGRTCVRLTRINPLRRYGAWNDMVNAPRRPQGSSALTRIRSSARDAIPLPYRRSRTGNPPDFSTSTCTVRVDPPPSGIEKREPLFRIGGATPFVGSTVA
jgi:hypothetical protein